MTTKVWAVAAAMLSSCFGVPLVSGVQSAGGGGSIVPNTWVEITGANLSSTTRTWQTSDFSAGNMPTQLDGVSVTINGKAAYVYYVSPTQVNVLTAPDALPASAQVIVSVNGSASVPYSVAAQALNPRFFTFDTTNIAATHADGKLLGPSTLYAGATTPAAPGETIVLYGLGFGPTSSAIVAGSATQSGTLSPLPTITIGGIAATVRFAG